jgi:thiamine-phosphate pyrophosphorylase
VDRPFPRLHVVTDTRPGRDPLDVIRAAVGAARDRGAADLLAVQVRVEDHATDRQAYELTVAALGLCRPAGVLCLVNDRLHVALAAGADGCHVGADDLPVPVVRQVLDAVAARVAAPRGGTVPGGASAPGRQWRSVLGATARVPSTARAAVRDGATYLGAGPAFGTTTKGGLPAPIGPAGVGAVARAVPGVPVIAIGGVTVAAVGALIAAGAHGVAVIGAVSSAADPRRATADLLDATAGQVPA